MQLEPTFGGALLSAAAVAAGPPLFNDGLRAIRLRRAFARLTQRPLADLPTGLTHVRGSVTLESPLFSPLTSRPCAGFRLEVLSETRSEHGFTEERRPFRLRQGGASALVLAGRGIWELGVTGTRPCKTGERLSENLERLLDRVPASSWARRRGVVNLVERALFADQEIHVVAYGRAARPLDAVAEEELLATGTDGAAWIAGAAGPLASRSPDLWLGPGETMDFLLVSEEPPSNLSRHVPAWRPLSALLGPAVGTGGLLYLAHAVDWLRAHGRF